MTDRLCIFYPTIKPTQPATAIPKPNLSAVFIPAPKHLTMIGSFIIFSRYYQNCFKEHALQTSCTSFNL